MTLNTNQLDLFDGAPYTHILGTVTDRPAKRLKPTPNNGMSNRASKKLNSLGSDVGVIQRTINDSVDILKNLGCEFIITTKDGRMFEHGEMPARLRQQAAPAKPKRTTRVPVGTYSSHYKPLLENLKVGDVAMVPFKSSLTGVNFSVPGLNSAVSAWTGTHWGSGAATSFINRKTKMIEVLRLK
jgi:hypothetical protein